MLWQLILPLPCRSITAFTWPALGPWCVSGAALAEAQRWYWLEQESVVASAAAIPLPWPTIRQLSQKRVLCPSYQVNL
ncbi:hypothetical protein ACPA9J_08720, partial [Pseudomonas aeruginosa]